MVNTVEKVKTNKEKRGKQHPSPEMCLQHVLRKDYEFRFNVITEQVEYRSKAQESDFDLLDKRHINSLCLELMEQGVKCWDQDVKRFIHSARIQDYHPFKAYMKELPVWDGKDWVELLIRRVTNDPICIRAMYRWLVAMVALWMGRHKDLSNSLMPILISHEQGLGKSTFCRNLLPDTLRTYYTDMADFTTKGRMHQRLVQNGLVNLDEFDSVASNKMALLKNLIQAKDVSLTKAYTNYFSNLPRIASFIDTSNRQDLLTDPSGSRCFICILIEKEIKNVYINHDQLYAEIEWLVEAGERTWLCHEEEVQLQEHSKAFYRETPGILLFKQYYSIDSENPLGEWKTMQEIVQELCKHRSAAHEISPFVLSQALSKSLDNACYPNFSVIQTSLAKYA